MQTAGPLLKHRTLHRLWEAPFWGEHADRALAFALAAAAAVGVCFLNTAGRRAAARLLGLAAVALLFLALAGTSWEPLGRLGTTELLPPALWFMVPPAAHALLTGFRLVIRLTGRPILGAGLAALPLLAAGVVGYPVLATLAARCAGTSPLRVGFSEDQQALMEAIRGHTGPESRILWQDCPDYWHGSRWTALLPVVTGRAYLGGLDPDVSIEHAYAEFLEQTLAGRAINHWSDADLEEFCRRYNISWVVCWSRPAVARFRAWTGAELLATVSPEGAGCLFRLRPQSFALKGQARLVCADAERIALADVVPEDGKVVLSLHYQKGLCASPSRVQVEREPDAHDPIAFVRLRVPGPVARVTLTWENRR
jgi:hypothetical protein